ncbi:sterol 3beta-glucosyltransferase [Entomortierella parvispora]|uniref:Sterol 3beta-glucosyltransferase n=1 Tax=Entomortierella parvispora TaxID=205924 RepID=A0A9P3HI72_9FUNG|nr:sterol 3beta-glucosyltransferase [Entomortierella parvispora]
MEGGHSCRIATHGEYKNWIEGHEIEFGHVGGDPGEPIELCVENGMFTVSFIREGLKKFRGWLDDNMKTPWKACQNTDVIIESPSAMAGIHVAEKLEIPYFRAFPFPWNRTRAFPHPFAVAERNLGRGYNYITYATIEQVFWKGVSGQINKWRHRSLDGLEEFLEADPDNKPVYIGFGSMAVSDPNEITRTIIEAVLKSNARAIISKGWSDKSGSKDGSKTTNYPAAIYMLESVPHDWLFHRLAGVVHHGGAGATAAGLRAGVLTMIKLYFGDQRFWAQREEDDGVSVWCRDLTVKKLSSSLSTITTDEKMIKKAQMMGERIRAEDGVGTAIQYFYHDRALAKGRLGDQQKKKEKVSRFNGIWTNQKPQEPWTGIGLQRESPAPL